MYIIVTLISICVFAAIANGIRLSLSPEPEQKIVEMTNEERLRRIYRNAYYSWVSLKDER
tara:strand:- start:16 stop:195 length:180 start_codon:yes stop_codon:yes gene_type:complete